MFYFPLLCDRIMLSSSCHSKVLKTSSSNIFFPLHKVQVVNSWRPFIFGSANSNWNLLTSLTKEKNVETLVFGLNSSYMYFDSFHFKPLDFFDHISFKILCFVFIKSD